MALTRREAQALVEERRPDTMWMLYLLSFASTLLVVLFGIICIAAGIFFIAESVEVRNPCTRSCDMCPGAEQHSNTGIANMHKVLALLITTAISAVAMMSFVSLPPFAPY